MGGVKCKEVFLIIPTFIFTKSTSIVIQLTLEIHLNPGLLSTILTPTFSYKAEAKVARNASRWLERVVVSILPLLVDVQRGAAPNSTGEPGHGSQTQPGWAALRLYRARGWQKGWLSNPCFRNYICEITAGRHVRAGNFRKQMPERKITISQGCYRACFYPWWAVRLQ